MTRKNFFAAATVLLALGSCKPDVPVDEFTSFTTAQASEITDNSANCGGTIVSVCEISEYGVFYSTTNKQPGESDSKAVSALVSEGVFVCNLTDLTSHSTYYARAYVKFTTGTIAIADNVVEFSTLYEPTMPVLSSPKADEVTSNEALLSFSVDYFGGLDEDGEYGFYYSDDASIQVADAAGIEAAGYGKVSAAVSLNENLSAVEAVPVSGLSPETKYYFVAYISNSLGKVLAPAASFTTTPKETPTVSDAFFLKETDLGYTKNTVSATLKAAGLSTVTVLGIVIGTENDVTKASLKMAAPASTTGDYSLTFSNMAPTTKYYAWAYATNSYGTTYSDNPLEFTTLTPGTWAVSNGAYVESVSCAAGNSNTAVVSVEFTLGSDEDMEGGMVFSTSKSPAYDSGSHATAQIKNGKVDVQMNGLDAGAIYFARSYLKKAASSEIIYGEEMNFRVPDYDRMVLVEGKKEYNFTCSSKKLNGTYEIPDLWICKYEVTTTEYAAFLNARGITDANCTDYLYYNASEAYPLSITYSASTGWTPVAGAENKPCAYVVYTGAVEYCKWMGGELPHSWWWNWAASGGNKSMGFTYPGSNDPLEVCYSSDNCAVENDYKQLMPVGSLKANELGLYDMAGNVWELIVEPATGVLYYKGGSIGFSTSSSSAGVYYTLSCGEYQRTAAQGAASGTASQAGFRFYKVK